MSSYQRTNGYVRSDECNGRHNGEQDALLPGKYQERSAWKRIRTHFNCDIDPKHGDYILLACYVVTGLLDSCATSAWGSFVSMQTGNTIYLGLGLSDIYGSTRWIKSATSIVLFCFGSYCFSHFHRYFSPKKRWVLAISFVVQMVMILVAAAIAFATPEPKDSTNNLHWHVMVPLAIVAFQSSGQAVTSRALEFDSLTSVVLTSTYCDLFSDVKLFSWPSENVERNRRAAAPVLLLLGAFFGGMWSRSEIGLAGALWTAAALKALMVVAWLFWPPAPVSQNAIEGN